MATGIPTGTGAGATFPSPRVAIVASTTIHFTAMKALLSPILSESSFVGSRAPYVVGLLLNKGAVIIANADGKVDHEAKVMTFEVLENFPTVNSVVFAGTGTPVPTSPHKVTSDPALSATDTSGNRSPQTGDIVITHDEHVGVSRQHSSAGPHYSMPLPQKPGNALLHSLCHFLLNMHSTEGIAQFDQLRAKATEAATKVGGTAAPDHSEASIPKGEDGRAPLFHSIPSKVLSSGVDKSSPYTEDFPPLAGSPRPLAIPKLPSTQGAGSYAASVLRQQHMLPPPGIMRPESTDTEAGAQPLGARKRSRAISTQTTVPTSKPSAVFLLSSDAAVGLAIGKDGSHVNRVRKLFGVDVDIDTTAKPAIVYIAGSSFEAVNLARAQLEFLTISYVSHNKWAASETGKATVRALAKSTGASIDEYTFPSSLERDIRVVFNIAGLRAAVIEARNRIVETMRAHTSDNLSSITPIVGDRSSSIPGAPGNDSSTSSGATSSSRTSATGSLRSSYISYPPRASSGVPFIGSSSSSFAPSKLTSPPLMASVMPVTGP